MRKIVFGLLLVACVTSVASAQLNLFYDARSSTAAIVTPAAPYLSAPSLCQYAAYGYGQNYPLNNGGGRGDGQMVWVGPVMKDFTDYLGTGGPDGRAENLHSWYDGVDQAQADAYLYAEYTAPTTDTVSSIGLTQTIPAAAFTASAGNFYLASVTTTVENGGLWKGTNVTGSNASTSLKYVQVPVAGSPPAFDTSVGLRNGSFEKIAKLHIQGAEMAYGQPPVVQSIGVKLAVNELLCTAVRYPGSAGALAINLGYVGGAPEAATDTGSVLGATSATDDLTIMAMRKGDFDLDGKPCTTLDDFAYFDIQTFYSPAANNCNAFEMWLADWDNDGLPASSLDDFEYFKHGNFPLGPPL